MSPCTITRRGSNTGSVGQPSSTDVPYEVVHGMPAMDSEQWTVVFENVAIDFAWARIQCDPPRLFLAFQKQVSFSL